MNKSASDFEIIIKKYRNSLYKIAVTFESNPDLIEDLHQDILFAIWKALPKFKNKSAVHTFIYRVAYNQAINHVTRVSKVGRFNKEIKCDDVVEVGDRYKTSDPERYASLQLDRQKIIAMIRKLPLIKRQLITLNLEGVSHDEIAEITGLSKNNIAVQISRTKQQLRKIMEK